MTDKERALAAFHNQPTDKLLVAFWHHYLEDELVDGLHHPKFVARNIAGAKTFYEEFHPAFVKVMTDGLFFMPFAYEDAHSAADMADLRPEADLEAYLDRSVEFAKDLRAMYGPDVLMFYNIFSAAFQVNHRMRQTHPEMAEAGGGSSIAWLLKQDPEAVKAALDKITDVTLELIDRILGAGIADGMYFSVSQFNRLVDDETYRKYLMPGEKRIIERANRYAKDNILHICGWRGSRNNLSLFTDYDCSVINWAVHAEGVSLAEGKKMFGGKCVIGGFGNDRTDLLCAGTKKEIQDYVEQIVAEAGTTGVIIGADCTTHLQTPDAHIHWVYEKAAEISERLLQK